MLEFTLAVDYQGYSAPSISATDRDHFMHVRKALLQLRSTVVRHSERPDPEVRPDPAERQVLAAYFWKYLFEPCKALSILLDFVYVSIDYLGQFTDGSGRYKGSVFGSLQLYGVAHLAAKLYWGRNVMILLIFTDYTSRNRMLHAVNTIEELYFHSIDGVEGSTAPDINTRTSRAFQDVKHEANERGIAYASTRKAAIARACKDLSTKYWTQVVEKCVDGVLARFKLVKDGKRKPDFPWVTWRGEGVDKMVSTHFRRPMDLPIPKGWWRVCSNHAPDYCEFRDQVLSSDC
ncbi:hypothetical protein Q7P36_000852 [Cladosporium allicinum]